jgi:hypothetical protein
MVRRTAEPLRRRYALDRTVLSLSCSVMRGVPGKYRAPQPPIKRTVVIVPLLCRILGLCHRHEDGRAQRSDKVIRLRTS